MLCVRAIPFAVDGPDLFDPDFQRLTHGSTLGLDGELVSGDVVNDRFERDRGAAAGSHRLLAGPDAIALIHRQDEDAAVADLPGPRRLR